jgi:RND family efflux transporter MFP subunit
MNEMVSPRRDIVTNSSAKRDAVAPDSQAGAAEDPRLHQARRRTAKFAGLGVATGVALMLGLGAWAHIQRGSSAAAALAAQQNSVPLVRTLDVAADAAPRVVDLPGTMQAFDTATLFARATGYISKRNVDIGSRVRVGDVLAVIAAPDLDQQLAQAQAQLGQMQAALLQAQAGKSLADVTNRRTSKMVSEGWNSRQQGDQDRSNLISQSAGVRVAQANIVAQQAQVNRLLELTGFEKVVAPFDGVITSRQVDVGTLVTADTSSGTPMFAIAHTDVLRVQVYVPQEYVFALRNGEAATITVPQLPGQVFHGTVARNAGALEADTRTLLAEVDVNNKDGALSPGLYGIVHLQQHSDTPVVSVPSEAIIFNPAGLNVAVVENGKVALRKLNVLNDDGARLQVQGGLKAGDRIILSPPVNVAPGMRVRTS